MIEAFSIFGWLVSGCSITWSAALLQPEANGLRRIIQKKKTAHEYFQSPPIRYNCIATLSWKQNIPLIG